MAAGDITKAYMRRAQLAGIRRLVVEGKATQLAEMGFKPAEIETLFKSNVIDLAMAQSLDAITAALLGARL